ncbi:MAG: hypothetical protein RLY16_583 [Bacteroidota bacterium]
MKTSIHIFYSFLFIASFYSCTPTKQTTIITDTKIIQSNIPDYGNINNWAAHPWKYDPSDSIPKPLRSGINSDSLADVFFIHPTTLTNEAYLEWNAWINDTLLNNKTDYSSILYQASAFNNSTRVFAPRYRQAHLRSYFTTDTLAGKKALAFAYEDVKKSFEYYLQHFNTGQPIIIASHSQGTEHAAKLLRDYFDNQKLSEKLICAYLIGMPVPNNYFKHITACKDSIETGCIVSWRTYHRGYIDSQFVAKEKFKSIVTNPLSWKIEDSMIVSRQYNIGGLLKNYNKLHPRLVDAEIHQNVLWTRKPKFFGNIFLRAKNYHIGDINLFYLNIKNNVALRIKEYLKITNRTTY